ncbi:PLP-dependent aminotransferase family protein [Rhodobacteraceae bacterium LMO-12]|nr:PLP-dependent aminotransferase family protein [Rhodobacteraceae bacterium LMO-JJ12]
MVGLFAEIDLHTSSSFSKFDRYSLANPTIENLRDGGDPTGGNPIYQQIYTQLREAIMSGLMPAGAKLPSIRVLSAQRGIARNTVVQAYEQLLAEGCVESRPGSGHYVADLSPEFLRSRPVPSEINLSTKSPLPSVLHDFSFVHPGFRTAMPMRPFRPNMPAIESEHLRSWIRIYTKVLRNARRKPGSHGLFGESDAQGESILREAIAEHVSYSRGVSCSSDQVIITSGAQHGMNLLLRVLGRPGDHALIEDPCFLGALAVLKSSGVEPIPVPVDREGMDLSRAMELAPDARLALVCPSHQHPLGYIMSAKRRLALIKWAQKAQAWIIEDDYDSEYRYSGQPIPSLQGLDGGNRVIYVGTFSKVLFPALRIGFIIAPEPLIAPLVGARAVSGRHGSAIDQEVLAQFIREGHLGRHIRKMRRLYRERLEALQQNCKTYLGGFLTLDSVVSGLQVVGWLPRHVNDLEFSQAAAQLGITLPNLSRYCISASLPPAVLFGFGAFSEKETIASFQKLAKLADTLRSP